MSVKEDLKNKEDEIKELLGSRIEQLDGKISDFDEEITKEIEEFNSYSEYVEMRLRMPIFHFTGDNEAAISVVLDDLNETLGIMKEAVETADFKGIKRAVKRLKNFDSVLPEDAAQKVVEAVASAKIQAKELKRRLVKEGETLEKVQADIDTSPIDIARLMLLDDDTDGISVDMTAVNNAEVEDRFADMMDE